MAIPGESRGPDPPYQSWRLFETVILKSTQTYITFKLADFFNEKRVEFCH